MSHPDTKTIPLCLLQMQRRCQLTTVLNEQSQYIESPTGDRQVYCETLCEM